LQTIPDQRRITALRFMLRRIRDNRFAATLENV
jgi:hypothetical protein